MLDDEDRVADVAEVFEDFDQPGIVTRVQADARFVEDVERADEQGTEVRRKLYPLGFAARKRRRETAERQIIKPDLDEEFESSTNFLQQFVCDLSAFLAHFELFKKLIGIADRHRNDLRQRKHADLNVAGRLPETLTVAVGASCVAAVFGKKNANVELVFLGFEPCKKAFQPAPAFVAVDDAILLKIGQVGERHRHIYVGRRRVFYQFFLCPGVCRTRERFDRAVL